MAAVSLLLLAAVGVTVVWLTWRAPLPKVLETRALTNDGLPKHSLATDDVRIYFAERVGGSYGLSQMSGSTNGVSIRKLSPP